MLLLPALTYPTHIFNGKGVLRSQPTKVVLSESFNTWRSGHIVIRGVVSHDQEASTVNIAVVSCEMKPIQASIKFEVLIKADSLPQRFACRPPWKRN